VQTLLTDEKLYGKKTLFDSQSTHLVNNEVTNRGIFEIFFLRQFCLWRPYRLYLYQGRGNILSGSTGRCVIRRWIISIVSVNIASWQGERDYSCVVITLVYNFMSSAHRFALCNVNSIVFEICKYRVVYVRVER